MGMVAKREERFQGEVRKVVEGVERRVESRMGGTKRGYTRDIKRGTRKRGRKKGRGWWDEEERQVKGEEGVETMEEVEWWRRKIQGSKRDV